MVVGRISHRKRFAFAILAAILLVVVIEGLLQLVAALSLPVHDSLFGVTATIADETLGHRPRPGILDHDDNGFSNRQALTTADIVAIGDSQTEGASLADRFSAWPHRLAELRNTAVYSMAYGGYGPTHYRVLLDEALQKRPRLVVVGFYAGNDLCDCYSMVYDDARLPRLKSTDPAIISRLDAAAKDRGPLNSRWEQLRASKSASLRGLLATHSSLYGLARGLYREIVTRKPVQVLWDDVRQQALNCPPDVQYPVDLDGIRTVLTVGARHAVIDLDDPRINEGLRLSIACLDEMHRLATKTGCEMLVVLIPTKELVFAEFLFDAVPGLPPELHELHADETALWQRLKTALQDKGIEFADALPALRSSIERGQSPYHANFDGHPNEVGHAAIAECVSAAMHSADVPEDTH